MHCLRPNVDFLGDFLFLVMEEKTKTCSRCKISKEYKDFNKNALGRDGLRPYCKLCRKSDNKKQYDNRNKEEVKNYNSKYREKNKQSISKYLEIYRQDNKEELSIKRKLTYVQNKEKILEDRKLYKINNLDKFKIKDKNYFTKNKTAIIKRSNEYSRKRKISDPTYKIAMGIRSLIGGCFKRSLENKYTKSKKTEDILKCNFKYFKDHIVKQFTKGMSLDKIGKDIELDHIIPISHAKTEEEIYLLNHWSNFQPLWTSENRKKGGLIYPVSNIELNLTIY